NSEWQQLREEICELRKFIQLSPEINAIPHHLRLGSSITTSSLVDFNSLWVIYRPGNLVVIDEKGFSECGRLATIRLSNDPNTRMPCYLLNYIQRNFDGETLPRGGMCEEQRRIDYFLGTRTIGSLHLIPLRLHPSKETLETLYRARKNRYENLIGNTNN